MGAQYTQLRNRKHVLLLNKVSGSDEGTEVRQVLIHLPRRPTRVNGNHIRSSVAVMEVKPEPTGLSHERIYVIIVRKLRLGAALRVLLQAP